MSRQQVRHLGWGLSGVVVLALAFALAIWRLGWAQDVTVKVIGEPEQSVKADGESEAKPDRGFYDTPEEFDAAKAEADADYYKKTDASRTWQTVPVKAGAKLPEQVLIVGDGFHLALPNAKLDQPLTVKVKSGMPVTFTALDGGLFPANGKNTITVKADEKGQAAVEFQTLDVGDYRVLAGSPENLGPAEFIIQCVTAQTKADIASGKHATDYLAEQKAAEDARKKAADALGQKIEQIRSTRPKK